MDLSKNSIAIVDDDEDILLSARLILKNYFNEVHCFEKPSDLLNQIQELDISAILLDLNYHRGQQDGSEGIQTLEEVKRRKANVEVIVMTAYAEVPLAVQAVRKGAFDLILLTLTTSGIFSYAENKLGTE